MYTYTQPSLVAQLVKNLPATRETWVQFLGWEDPLEKEMATHSNILAWKIPRTEKPGRLQSMGSQRSDMTETNTFTFICFLIHIPTYFKDCVLLGSYLSIFFTEKIVKLHRHHFAVSSCFKTYFIGHKLSFYFEMLTIRLAACMLSCFSCVPVCSLMDCTPPGSSVHGILQVKILECIAMPSSLYGLIVHKYSEFIYSTYLFNSYCGPKEVASISQ